MEAAVGGGGEQELGVGGLAGGGGLREGVDGDVEEVGGCGEGGDDGGCRWSLRNCESGTSRLRGLVRLCVEARWGGMIYVHECRHSNV